MSTSKKSMISQWLRERVESGIYPVGDFLPSENQLAELMGVSRPTVRTALNALTQEGLVTPLKGVGYQVIAQKAALAKMLQFDSVSDLVEFNSQNPRKIMQAISALSSGFLAQIGFHDSLKGWSGFLFERQLLGWKPRSYIGEILIHPLVSQHLSQFEEMDTPYFRSIEKALGHRLTINQYITILASSSPLRQAHLDVDVDYFDIYRIYSDPKGDAYQISRNIISSEKFFCHTTINDS